MLEQFCFVLDLEEIKSFLNTFFKKKIKIDFAKFTKKFHSNIKSLKLILKKLNK